jgi:putative DNA primase/helicase
VQVLEKLADGDGRTKDNSRAEAEELLVTHIINKYYIKTILQDERLEIWAYCDGIYLNTGQSLIKKELREILGLAYKNIISKNVTDKITADTYIKASEFFINDYPYLLPLKDNILDLKTLKTIDFDPNKIFFSKLSINYNINAKCPNIQKHLNNVFKDKSDVNLFQESLGNCLIREYKYQKSVMFSGSGRNGKGVTLDIVRRLFTTDNCSGVSLQQLEEDNFAYGELYGKMVNMCGDLDKTSLQTTGKFKMATGGDLVSGARKFLNPITFSNYAKFFFACNELPIVYDDSRGFWDRWLFFDFSYTFVSKEEYNNKSKEQKNRCKVIDTSIKDNLFTDEELEGLLNFAVVGMKRLERNNGFTSSITHEEIKLKWKCKSDSFIAFCLRKVEISQTDYITKSDLRQQYTLFCHSNNESIFGDQHIKTIVTTKYGAYEKKIQVKDYSKEEDKYNYTRERVWYGVKFKEVNN